MPFYNSLRPESAEDQRTIAGLLRLKSALDLEIPKKTLDYTLIVATWNLREFGGNNKGGARPVEPLYYIAEVMSRFDLIAVQEVRDDLNDLERLVRILGRWWDFVVTDVTFGRQGNSERVAFIYDTRKLTFGGLAGEVVPEMKKDAAGTLAADFAFSRSPYLVGFQAGWFRFTICSTHLYYGEGKADVPQRAKEMEHLVRLLKKRIESKDRWARNVVVLGDFNIFDTAKESKDPTFKALSTAFSRADAFNDQNLDRSNAGRSKPYDQIGFLSPDVGNQLAKARAGIFDFFQHVYRLNEEDEASYAAESKGFSKGYKEWRTFKMSDHLPKWVEVQIDFGTDYLKRKSQGETRTDAASLESGPSAKNEAPAAAGKVKPPKRKPKKKS